MMMVAGVAFVVVVLVMLVVGALAGWLAGLIMGQRHRGFWNNAGLGILGSIVGSLVFSLAGIFTAGLFGAALGAAPFVELPDVGEPVFAATCFGGASTRISPGPSV